MALVAVTGIVPRDEECPETAEAYKSGIVSEALRIHNDECSKQEQWSSTTYTLETASLLHYSNMQGTNEWR